MGKFSRALDFKPLGNPQQQMFIRAIEPPMLSWAGERAVLLEVGGLLGKQTLLNRDHDRILARINSAKTRFQTAHPPLCELYVWWETIRSHQRLAAAILHLYSRLQSAFLTIASRLHQVCRVSPLEINL